MTVQVNCQFKTWSRLARLPPRRRGSNVGSEHKTEEVAVTDREREREEPALDDDLEVRDEASEDVKGGAPVKSNVIKSTEQQAQGIIGNIRG